MQRVTDPLALMGARVQTADGGTPPLHIFGGRELEPLHYELPMASAQVKSCVLLAGLYARGRTCVTEPAPTRDHTERMLQAFGWPVRDSESIPGLPKRPVSRCRLWMRLFSHTPATR